MTPFLRCAIGFYLLATTLGVLLRWSFVAPVDGLPFSNALHAHSHTLYFGWAALAVFALGFRRLGADDRKVRVTLGAIVAVAAAGFVSFLHGGYSLPSIVISSLSLGVWLGAVVLLLRRAKGRAELDVAFLRVAACYVLIAGSSAMTRVVLLAVDAPPLYGQLAVFGFLHAFATFFVLGIFALLLWQARERGARFDERGLRASLAWLAALSAFTFPLGVSGGTATVLGDLARVAAILLVVPSARLGLHFWRGLATVEPSARRGLRSLALVWGLKVLMDAAGALGLAELATLHRHPAIAYLHIVLLGFVSASIIVLLRLVAQRPLGSGLWLHFGGLAVMTAGLLLAPLPLLLRFDAPGLVRVALVLAFAGGAVIVMAALVWTRGLLLPERTARSAGLPLTQLQKS